MTTRVPFNLIHLAKSTLKKRLLAYFFTNPESQLYLREIASLIHVDPTNLLRTLRDFEAEGVFISVKRGNQKYFSLNRKYPLFEELKSTIFKTVGVSGTLKTLFKKLPGIKRAFIYGSFAKNSERASSDIDLCLVIKKSEFKEEALLKELHALEKQLGREISYIFFSEEEWNKKITEKDSFREGILKGKRVELV